MVVKDENSTVIWWICSHKSLITNITKTKQNNNKKKKQFYYGEIIGLFAHSTFAVWKISHTCHRHASFFDLNIILMQKKWVENACLSNLRSIKSLDNSFLNKIMINESFFFRSSMKPNICVRKRTRILISQNYNFVFNRIAQSKPNYTTFYILTFYNTDVNVVFALVDFWFRLKQYSSLPKFRFPSKDSLQSCINKIKTSHMFRINTSTTEFMQKARKRREKKSHLK